MHAGFKSLNPAQDMLLAWQPPNTVVCTCTLQRDQALRSGLSVSLQHDQPSHLLLTQVSACLTPAQGTSWWRSALPTRCRCCSTAARRECSRCRQDSSTLAGQAHSAAPGRSHKPCQSWAAISPQTAARPSIRQLICCVSAASLHTDGASAVRARMLVLVGRVVLPKR